MSVYVETSALLRAILDEPGARDINTLIENALGSRTKLISSALLEVELDRVAFREGIDRAIIDDALDGIYLASIDQMVLDRAAGLQFHIRTLDAIHLATAAVLNDEMPGLQVLSCDRRVVDGATTLGLGVVADV